MLCLWTLEDALTLGTHFALFNPFYVLHLHHSLHLEDPHSIQSPPLAPSGIVPEVVGHEETQLVNHVSSASGPAHQSVGGGLSAASDEKSESNPFYSSPVVTMVTKHANGTLFLLHFALSDQSKFTQVLSVSHATRIPGHR